jgi:predicted nucleotidyltransferase
MVTLTINSTLARCKKTLARHYGKRFQGLILYGSVARADADAASDIDLLVLLAPPFDYSAEMRAIVDLLYPIQMETDPLISAKPAPVSDYATGSISIYRTIQREGVAV